MTAQQGFPQYGDPFVDQTGRITRSWRTLLQTIWSRTGTTTGVISSSNGGAGSVSGILKANGSGVVSAAVAGTDYQSPTGSGAGLTSLNGSAIASGTVPSAYGGAGSVSGILKANGSGVVSAAVAGTDYLTPTGTITRQYSVPTSGSTVTVVPVGPYHTVLMNPTGTLASLTVALPGSPITGQIVVLCSSQAVTSLTISGGTTIQTISSLAGSTPVRLQYEPTSAKWWTV